MQCALIFTPNNISLKCKDWVKTTIFKFTAADEHRNSDDQMNDVRQEKNKPCYERDKLFGLSQSLSMQIFFGEPNYHLIHISRRTSPKYIDIQP